MRDLQQPRESLAISGTVARIHVPQRTEGWCVASLNTNAGTVLTAGVYPPGLTSGMAVTAVGSWTSYNGNPQFKVASAQTEIERTRAGITAWLQTVKGVGPVLSERIFDHLAPDVDYSADAVWSILRDHPERVLEVKGLAKIGDKVVAAIQTQTVLGELLTWLMGYGISIAYCRRIIDRYGMEAVSRVRSNPYLLTEVRGIGFIKADEIGRRIGIALDSPHRIAAGVEYVIEQAEASGHCYLPFDELERTALKLLDPDGTAIDGDVVNAAVVNLREHGKLVMDQGRDIWSIALWEAEQRVSSWLDKASRIHASVGVSDGVLAAFEAEAKVTLHSDQRNAVAGSLQASVAVITGGPGTGKSMLLAALLACYDSLGLIVLMCAPTGRAAKRMQEATGRQASTVHRLIGWDGRPQEPGHFLKADVVVVDETSMACIRIMDALLNRLHPRTRLILVGDVDQLPSVGPGQVLSDIIARGVPAFRLTHVQRQAAGSMIVSGAHAINAGQTPRTCYGTELQAKSGQLAFVEVDDSAELIDAVEEGFEALARLGYARESVAVMAPQRTGLAGVKALNERLQATFNPRGTPVNGAPGIRIGDRVMQTRNNYRLDVYNGDIGHVIAPPTKDPDDDDAPDIRCKVDYDREVNYVEDDLDQITLAYASTVHKMQGVESPAVMVICHSSHYFMLSRRLIYTAITRGREIVILIGDRKGLWRAVKNADTSKRYTKLGNR